MNIYFARSIRGERDSKEKFLKTIAWLKQYGEVLTEFIDPNTIASEDRKHFSDIDIYKEDTDWIRESDIVFADVTVPSLGVGYELAFAEASGKRVVCIFDESAGKNLSAMVSGNEYFEIKNFKTHEELEQIIHSVFKKRFN